MFIVKGKENILIYPYDSNTTDLLRSESFCERYNNIYLCSLEGWGLEGKNAGEADKGHKIVGKQVDSSFEQCLEKSSTVVFVESDQKILKGKCIYPQMYKAASERKNIVDLLVKNKIEHEITTFCMECDARYSRYRGNDIQLKIDEHIKRTGLVDTKVPIIVVAGETANLKKFSVQYGLKAELESKGYNVALIGSKSYCEFLGDTSFPRFMLKKEIPDTEQVLMFNRFIKKIERDKNPDAIILGIPGGMISCTDRIYGDFGIVAYKVFQAINVDFLIFNVEYENYYPEYFDEMRTFICQKFSCDVDVFNVCNKHIDWEKVETIRPIEVPFLSLSFESINSEIKRMTKDSIVPVVSSIDGTGIKKITKLLIEKLETKDGRIVF
jgi:peptide maturation system protein (TIGR04066 family)